MKKLLLKKIGRIALCVNLFTITSLAVNAQVNGDYRTRDSGRGWFGTGGSVAWQMYTESTNSWANAPSAPTSSTNVFIRDGFNQSANATGTLANNVTVGFGGGFRATANVAAGVVTSIDVIDGGRLNFLPSVSIFGAATTQATATVSSLKVSGFNFTNGGSNYGTNFADWAASTAYALNVQVRSSGNIYICRTAGTSGATAPTGTGTGISDGVCTWDYVRPITVGPAATVRIGNLWTTGTSYTANTSQVNSGGNLYTCRTTGLAGATAPTGTGTGISDGTLTWDYAGPAATATANVTGGSVTSLTLVTEGAGYLAIPGVTILANEAGSGASYQAQVGVLSINITAGGEGYLVAPLVTMGSIIQIGNSTTNRVVTINGNLAFNSGATIQSGGPTNTAAAGAVQDLTLGGDLSAVTPISFRNEWIAPVVPGNTNVTFNKAGTSTLSGARMTFNNITVNSGTTLNITNEVVILGDLVNNGTIINNSGFPLIINGTTTGTGTLPITLTSFTAQSGLSSVKVSWTTSSETNNDRFEVLKSTDGINFTKIATVKGKGPSIYTVDDYFPFNGTNYYKLLQYDLDGTVKDEGIRFANFSFDNNEISSVIYPNPFKSSASVFVKLKQGTGNTKLTLYASDGKIVHQESVNNIGSGGYELKIKNTLNPGMYFLNVNNGNSSERLKVIVE